MKGHTLWFTGLSCSGKTTVSTELVKILRKRNVPVILLDGDIIRRTLSSDLGYSKEDRHKQACRVADICYMITENKVLNIACTISPSKEDRDYAKKLIKNLVEVYIKCPFSVCEKRDVKGHYKLAKEGKIKNFVGIDITYEEPKNPDITLETDKYSINECAGKLLDYLEKKDII